MNEQTQILKYHDYDLEVHVKYEDIPSLNTSHKIVAKFVVLLFWFRHRLLLRTVDPDIFTIGSYTSTKTILIMIFVLNCLTWDKNVNEMRGISFALTLLKFQEKEVKILIMNWTSRLVTSWQKKGPPFRVLYLQGYPWCKRDRFSMNRYQLNWMRSQFQWYFYKFT